MAVCSFCGADEDVAKIKLLKCAKCKVPSYCSKQCQKEDWKHHKTCCRPIPEGLVNPSIPVRGDERALVQAFNQLQRTPILLHKDRNNHWHFAARPISATGSCLFATHLVTNRTYIGGPFLLSADESLDKWAACVVPSLLSVFLESTYSSKTQDSYGTECGGERRAPWTWSTTNLELALAAEKRLRQIGVKEELCHVGWSSSGEQALELQAAQWATTLAEGNKSPHSQMRTWDSIRRSNLKLNTDGIQGGEASDTMSKTNVLKESSTTLVAENSESQDAIPPVDDDID